MMELSTAKILITGGGSGIGRFVAMRLLEGAAKVIVIDRNAESIESFPRHSNLLIYKCDITQPLAVESVVREIFLSHGGVNVCINNAGIIHSEPLVNLLSRGDKKHHLDNWQKVIDVNLNAVFYVSSNVVEQMLLKKERGLIINISSISARGNIGQSAYAASKAAVEALAKTWSKELGIFKIRCASIAPGFFDTPSTIHSLSDHMLVKWQKAIPIGRLGKLEEILSAILFVIENDYFNGNTLALDGGLTF
jgi:3-oxoacyl-[acyl-carrier protein] reductase